MCSHSGWHLPRVATARTPTAACVSSPLFCAAGGSLAGCKGPARAPGCLPSGPGQGSQSCRERGGAEGGVSAPASCSVLPATRPGAQERRVESRRVESHGSFVFDLLRSFQLFPGWVHTPPTPESRWSPGRTPSLLLVLFSQRGVGGTSLSCLALCICVANLLPVKKLKLFSF